MVPFRIPTQIVLISSFVPIRLLEVIGIRQKSPEAKSGLRGGYSMTKIPFVAIHEPAYEEICDPTLSR